MQFIRFVLLSAVGFSCAGCAQDNDLNQEAIQTVEMTVKMPRKAHPLASYERYYARRSDGTIVGVYANHDDDHRDQVLKACRGWQNPPFPCPVGSEGVRLVQAGQSLWLEDPLDLPRMSGGGCAQVNVEYDPIIDRFERVECNGPY